MLTIELPEDSLGHSMICYGVSLYLQIPIMAITSIIAFALELNFALRARKFTPKYLLRGHRKMILIRRAVGSFAAFSIVGRVTSSNLSLELRKDLMASYVILLIFCMASLSRYSFSPTSRGDTNF